MQDLVTLHYQKPSGSRHHLLAPFRTTIGLEEDDTDWITLPSVIPPLNLEQAPTGSGWILIIISEEVERRVLEERDFMVAFKEVRPGLSPHLLNVGSAAIWNAPLAHESLLQPSSCFNIFGFILRVLKTLPTGITELIRVVKEEMRDLAFKLRKVPILGTQATGVREEDMLIAYKDKEMYVCRFPNLHVVAVA